MQPTPDPLEGTDPIDWDGIPFESAKAVMAVLATTDADLWREWFLGSGVVDAELVAAGGPDALDAIWAGVLRAIDAGWFTSCTWDELVAAGPVPLWCRIRPGYEKFFGAVGCWVTAGMVASTCRWLEQELGSTWMLPEVPRGADRSEPVLATPGGWRGILPYTQFVVTVARAVGGLSQGPVERDPRRLRELVFLMSPEQQSVDPVEDFVGPIVSPADDRSWMIEFSDLQGHDEDDRIERFVEVLSRSDGLDRVYREDRELVIVETVLSQGEVQGLADRIWDELGGSDDG